MFCKWLGWCWKTQTVPYGVLMWLNIPRGFRNLNWCSQLFKVIWKLGANIFDVFKFYFSFGTHARSHQVNLGKRLPASCWEGKEAALTLDQCRGKIELRFALTVSTIASSCIQSSRLSQFHKFSGWSLLYIATEGSSDFLNQLAAGRPKEWWLGCNQSIRTNGALWVI